MSSCHTAETKGLNCSKSFLSGSQKALKTNTFTRKLALTKNANTSIQTHEVSTSAKYAAAPVH